ncbi:MAG: Fpg/Nei family DNA glycosylase [Brooklawnia sp.]|jgi:formamidopyrimidine-DNA glycosylase
MPEGHVTHRLAGGLIERFAGRRVRVSSPQGRFADGARLVDGTTLEHAESVGKHLLIDFEAGRTIWIHLGLIGKLRFVPDEPAPSPQTLRLRIAQAGQAADLRGPQWCRLIPPDERAVVIARSGPDPLRADADPERAWRKVHASSRPIGVLLMDQSAFAGVGNIFRAEVLFRCGIAPTLPANQLPRAAFDVVWADLVAMMGYARVTGRIDTVSAEHLPEAMGRPARDDPHGGEVYVYRRAGLPCLVCGTEVATSALAGRNLYWCPRCQRRGTTLVVPAPIPVPPAHAAS